MRHSVLFLLAVFVLSLLIVGRGPGARCLLALAGCAALCSLTGWLVARGDVQPLLATLLCAFFCLLAVVFGLLTPWRNACAAFLGAAAALLAAFGVAAVSVWQLKLTGVFDTVTRDVWYGTGTGHVGLHWIVLGGMVVASVGVVADLAIAVTSAMAQVQTVKPGADRRELFGVGLRLGGDVTGTEVNTLVYVLLGLNLGAVLLPLARPDVQQAPVPWLEVLNRQAVAVEMVTALAGTLGLALAIPLTACFAAAVLGGRRTDETL